MQNSSLISKLGKCEKIVRTVSGSVSPGQGATVGELGDFIQLAVRVFLVSKQPFCQQWLWQNCDKKVTYYYNLQECRIDPTFFILHVDSSSVTIYSISHQVITFLQPDCFLVNIIQADASSFVVLRTTCATAMLVGSVNVPVGGHLRKCFFFFLFSTYL